MTREQMLSYILNAISTDAGLLALFRAAAPTQINAQSDERLVVLIQMLQSQGF